jgi:hypothetical protein
MGGLEYFGRRGDGNAPVGDSASVLEAGGPDGAGDSAADSGGRVGGVRSIGGPAGVARSALDDAASAPPGSPEPDEEHETATRGTAATATARA